MNYPGMVMQKLLWNDGMTSHNRLNGIILLKYGKIFLPRTMLAISIMCSISEAIITDWL